ncbi:MAG: bifunctional (p)ppGpp synthetase/guanosine-3',5'-bis(diphosphate) 3'-pyrophosphohydrolase, partial [Candidatus Hydrogenedentes bacterium]|nr:bifunctional (p)ppGpp synthetase/guanosine-3',5'-bis(diphosphate) 3'-pyrophosphohydrolase [Candidatus Hydrogenedentota bacterium]
GLDAEVCAAALLHDVVEDTDYTNEMIEKEFGPDIARIVEGVTKISRFNFTDDMVGHEEHQAQNIRKLLVATAKDIRVIVIKLADRLHNMRTLEFLDVKTRERISRETLDIYAPLAHRLGISRWKWELEDHAFHHLMPETYKEIARMVTMKRHEREAYLNKTVAFLEERLAEAEVVVHVIGRPKHLYSIYEKMQQQGKEFSQVMDVLGIRIITRTDAGCYNALGVVHRLWTPIPGRLKDYIAMPKLNMYQAIHTTVMRENGISMEVQIRSESMDRIAREGIAAHWNYKEGDSRSDDRLDTQLAWLQKMYDWLKDAGDQEHLMDSMRQDFTSTYIYVFTPRGELKELPQGATPLDFAYMIHSDVGDHCIGARVNGRIVPIRYNLQTGDSVEILNSKNQKPHLDWVDVVVTGRARTRIRQRLRELGTLAPSEEQVVSKPKIHRVSPKAPPPSAVREVDESTRRKLVRIEGQKGMEVQFAKCCNPMPGHAIVGYVTKTPGISIHRAICKSFARSARDHSRIVQATWEGEGMLLAKIRLVTKNRPNLLADITNSLRPLNIDILHAQFGPGEEGEDHFDFQFEAADQDVIEQVTQIVTHVPGVFETLYLGAQDKGAEEKPSKPGKKRLKDSG